MPLTDEEITEARAMRKNGMAWYRIGKVFGVAEDTVRAAIEPGFAEMRREQKNLRRRARKENCAFLTPVGVSRATREATKNDFLARLAEIPPDTRSLTARIAGDPLPGRSALDRRYSALYRKMQEDYDLDCEGAR